MTPKEKAKELYNEFYIPSLRFATTKEDSDWRHRTSKKYATMVVDEILKLTPIDGKLSLCDYSYINFKYWQEVKQEIEKL